MTNKWGELKLAPPTVVYKNQINIEIAMPNTEELTNYTSAIFHSLEAIREILDPYNDEEIVPTDPGEFAEFIGTMGDLYDNLLEIHDEVSELIVNMESWEDLIENEELLGILDIDEEDDNYTDF